MPSLVLITTWVPVRTSLKCLDLSSKTLTISISSSSNPNSSGLVDVSLSAEFDRQDIDGDVRAALFSPSNVLFTPCPNSFIIERPFNITVLRP